MNHSLKNSIIMSNTIRVKAISYKADFNSIKNVNTTLTVLESHKNIWYSPIDEEYFTIYTCYKGIYFEVGSCYDYQLPQISQTKYSCDEHIKDFLYSVHRPSLIHLEVLKSIESEQDNYKALLVKREEFDRIRNEEEKQKQLERERKEQEEAERERKEQEELLLKLIEDVKNEKDIALIHYEMLAKKVGYYLHMNTIGSIRKQSHAVVCDGGGSLKWYNKRTQNTTINTYFKIVEEVNKLIRES